MEGTYQHESPVTCPSCGKQSRRGKVMNSEVIKKPIAGGISICFQCSALNYYNEKLQLVTFTEEMQFALKMTNPTGWRDVMATVIAVRLAKSHKR